MEENYNLNDSYEYIEDDFIENDSSDNNSFFPPREFILILIFSSIIILILIEKIFGSVFLFIIPSKFFLIIFLLILNLLILRYLIITAVFIGRNDFVKFYFRSFVAKKKAKLLIQYLTNYNVKIDKILNYHNIEEIQKTPSQLISKSKIIQKYIDIYQNIQNKYGTMSSYSQNFYEHLLALKNKIENSSLKDIYNTIENNGEMIITEKNKTDLIDIKNEVEKLKNILIEFRESKSMCPNILNIKGIINNDIFQSKEFTRESILLKRTNCNKLIINTQNDIKLDCLLITSNNNKEDNNNKSQNLIIVSGPNLIPYDNLISSWDIDTLYTNNKIDLLFWNYRGYGFSEGSADFDNVCSDIITIYDYMKNNYSYNKIGVYGFSIGGIAACHLANNREINLLIADRTFGSSKQVVDHFSIGKYVIYLGKILFISLVDNTNNYLSTKCNKIILNDVQDQIIFDSISLKSSIARNIIFKIFNETNPESNIRNIKSENILDYALEPEESSQIYNAFKYTISFLKNKNQRKNIDIYNEKKFDDKYQKLNEEVVVNENNKENINVKETLEIFNDKLKLLYSNFFCPNNSFEFFLDNQCKKIHFHNFFNSLAVFGPEDISLKHYSICSTKYIDNELSNFINEVDNILNNEEIRKFSEFLIYQKLSLLNECIKKLKIFLSGLNMEEIENKWLKQMKGLLIPLNCGHTSFYYEDKTINTLIYLIKETFNNNESIALEPPLIENNI